MTRTIVAALFITLVGLALPDAAEARGKSRLLGATRLAHHENDLDIVRTACVPRVQAIKLKAKRGQVEIERLWVRYGDGTTDFLNVRERIGKGGETRWIDLAGGKRCVTEVGVIGDTELSRDRARVDIFGRF